MSLTMTVTALELDSTTDDFDIPNDDDHSLVGDPETSAQTSNPNSSFSIRTDTDDEFESEQAPVNASATVAQQVQMHFGMNNTLQQPLQ